MGFFKKQNVGAQKIMRVLGVLHSQAGSICIGWEICPGLTYLVCDDWFGKHTDDFYILNLFALFNFLCCRFLCFKIFSVLLLSQKVFFNNKNKKILSTWFYVFLLHLFAVALKLILRLKVWWKHQTHLIFTSDFPK